MEAIRWERRLLIKIFRWRRRSDESQLLFNKRVADKLGLWQARFRYKSIHAHILERVHTQLWHEKNSSWNPRYGEDRSRWLVLGGNEGRQQREA